MLNVDHNIILKRSFFQKKLTMGFTFRIVKNKTKQITPACCLPQAETEIVSTLRPLLPCYFSGTGVTPQPAVSVFNRGRYDPPESQGRGSVGTAGCPLGVSAVGGRCVTGPDRPKVKYQVRHPEALYPWAIGLPSWPQFPMC